MTPLFFSVGKMFKSMKDLFASSGTPSPGREKTGLSLSAVKSLVLRDKEDRFTSKFEDERMMVLINALFESGRFDISFL